MIHTIIAPVPLRLRPCVLLLTVLAFTSLAAALELIPPPPSESRGDDVLFLIFEVDNPAGRFDAELKPDLPEGFTLLSSRDRVIDAGLQLLPLSVDVSTRVAAGEYRLCFRLERDNDDPGVTFRDAEACAEVRIEAREGLEVIVPSRMYGEDLMLELHNRGNRTETVTVRSEGDARLVERFQVELEPGERLQETLTVRGTGRMRLFVNERPYTVRVDSLDGLPPALELQVRSDLTVDPLQPWVSPQLTIEGPLSDRISVRSRVLPAPFVNVNSGSLEVTLGRLSSPISGDGVSLRVGDALRMILAVAARDDNVQAGAEVRYQADLDANLGVFYDGEEFWSRGSLSGDLSPDWRGQIGFDRHEIRGTLNYRSEIDSSFGVRYGFAGSVRAEASVRDQRGYGNLDYSLDQNNRQSVRLRFGQDPIEARFEVRWQPERDTVFNWRVSVRDALGPGRYTLFAGVQNDDLMIGGSYALPILPGLSGNASLQYQNELRYSASLAYRRGPWSVNTTASGERASLRIDYQDDAWRVRAEGSVGSTNRVRLSGSYTFAVPVPESVITELGGRRLAAVSGQVRFEDGEGVPGVILELGQRRVRTDDDGRYTIWIAPGTHTMQIVPDGLPPATLRPSSRRIELIEFERRTENWVLTPAAALALECEGAEDDQRPGINLQGEPGSATLACGRTLGGLQAGTYRLSPFGHGESEAELPSEITLQAGKTETLTLRLTPPPPPEVVRPTLTLRVDTPNLAAPGEAITLRATSNAERVYAELPDGSQLPFDEDDEGLYLHVQIPFGVAQPIYRLTLIAEAADDQLTRPAMIRLDASRTLFDASLRPARAHPGQDVTLRVDTRFTPDTVRFSAADLSGELSQQARHHYQTTFTVPDAWLEDGEVTVTVEVIGEEVFEGRYRLRVVEEE